MAGSETADVAVLCFDNDDSLTQSWTHYFARRGQEVHFHTPESLAQARAILKKHTIAFSLAYASSPSTAGKSLSKRFSLLSSQFPPLVVVVDKDPNPAELERFREQGVSHVLTSSFDPGKDIPQIEAILRSGSWFTADMHSAPLPDVLQMMERNGRSVLVSIARSSEQPLSDLPWHKRRGKAWQGRLYLRNGQMIRAETPNAEGVHALAQMLSLRDGTIRVHDVYVEPLAPNTSGSIQNALLDATVAMDEMDKDGSSGVPAPTYDDDGDDSPTADDGDVDIVFDVVGQESEGDQAAAAAKGHENMSGLKALLGIAPNLQGAARADKTGSVVELAGEIQAETACAVAAMGTQQLEGAAAVLGLGDIKGWSVVTQNLSLYVSRRPDGMTVVVGGAARNAEVNLQKIAAHQAK